jgi:hypothetical protein
MLDVRGLHLRHRVEYLDACADISSIMEALMRQHRLQHSHIVVGSMAFFVAHSARCWIYGRSQSVCGVP